MQASAASAPTFVAESRSRRLTSYRAILWFALLTYPLDPWLLFHSARLWDSGRLLSAAGLLLSFAWAVAAPVMAWFTLCEADRVRLDRLGHPQVAREAILAAVGWPFFVLSGAVLAWVHAGAYQALLWYVLLAAVFASRRLAPPQTIQAPGRLLERAHRTSALLLLAFGAAHVVNHLFALDSLQAHVAVQNLLRIVYRQPAVEVLIVVAALLQAGTGTRMISRARLQRSTGLRNVQVLAGAFLGMFFLSHLTGVFISGRLLQGVDTTFAWATGGPHGLLTNARSPQFIPYYTLAVLALFLHAACAGRWTLASFAGASRALRICYGVMAMGVIVSLALLLPMAGVHLR